MAEGFDPLAAAACYMDPSVSAILCTQDHQGLFGAACTFIFSQVYVSITWCMLLATITVHCHFLVDES